MSSIWLLLVKTKTKTDVVFRNFGTHCGKTDVAIMTNARSEDALHPMVTSGLSFEDVDEARKVFIHRPILGWVEFTVVHNHLAIAQKRNLDSWHNRRASWMIAKVKGTVSSRSEQTFNRAWNRCPILRWKLLAHLCTSNGNMSLSCGVLFSVTELI